MIEICIDKIIKDIGDPYALLNQHARIYSHSGIHRKWWNAGQLSILFLRGDPVVQNKIKQMAMDWTKYANIKFQFVDDKQDADIRIDFQVNGSWSYIGTDATHIPQNQPTMNYGWLQKDTPDSEYHIVLHEFGHALGLIHEIQVPLDGIPWNKEAVYNCFSSAPHYWNREMVDQEIFERYSRSYSNSFLDQRSIMNYHIPQVFLMPNAIEIPWSTDLSAEDIRVIKTMYP